MAQHFALAELVVHELDLNTRIWTKGVDESLLHTSDDAPGTNTLDVMAAASGETLTEGRLWKAVTDAIAAYSTEEKEPVPRPVETRVQVEHGGAESSVSYGFSVAFFLYFLISAACAVACVSGLRLLGASGDLGPAGDLVAWLPSVPLVDDYVQASPLAWLIGGGLLGSVFSLGWLLHVRKVVIGVDAVRVYRGLRPTPRRYPRPPYDLIVGLERTVHLGRAGGLSLISLINPGASPMLPKDQARWVAFEMRQALRRTAQGR